MKDSSIPPRNKIIIKETQKKNNNNIQTKTNLPGKTIPIKRHMEGKIVSNKEIKLEKRCFNTLRIELSGLEIIVKINNC